MSGPPISNVFPSVCGVSIDLERYVITSPMNIGWHLVNTHLGQIIRGNLSTRYLNISKDPPPLPSITAARKIVTFEFDFFNISPTCFLLSMCCESSDSFPYVKPPK